jgi:hypothetical protein
LQFEKCFFNEKQNIILQKNKYAAFVKYKQGDITLVLGKYVCKRNFSEKQIFAC